MADHDPMRDGKPQAGPRTFGGEKWIEYDLLPVEWNPRAGVLDSYDHSWAFPIKGEDSIFNTDGEGAAFLHSLKGILNQVIQNLLDFNGISKNLGKVLPAVFSNFDSIPCYP